ncbi:LPP20 family lipoprotein [Oceanobacter mangrovi]|uniref:LPP20 family lipoprotein n=1 Tax=Oceanobacter mangrovi TaxID=2862510 RepID=UPI001C8D95C8|nr:LPP20 family lipoprotein [Oceanobacter mangrovi]
MKHSHVLPAPKKLARGLLIAATALTLAACGSVATKPQAENDSIDSSLPSWVVNPPQRHAMAYGVGSMEVYGDPADAIKRASELARVDLLSQLRVTVSGDFTSTVSESKGTGQLTKVQSEVQQKVRSQVPAVTLDEMTIRDAAVTAGVAYALAELDREAAVARLQQQMTEIEQQLDQYAVITDNQPVLSQLRLLLPALGLIEERQAFADKIGLVALDHQVPTLTSSHKALQQRIYDLLNQLTVRVSFDNREARDMSGDLIEALTSQGLKIQQQGSSDLEFRLSAERSSRTQDERFYAFVNARIQIIDADGRILSSFSDNARGVSGMENLAWQKASAAVADKLQQELAATLAERLM